MEQDLNYMIPVLSKPSYLRSDVEIKGVSEILQQLYIFRSMSHDLPKDTIDKCACLFKYEFKPAGSFVMEYGEKSNRYYIIIHGRVGILVPEQSQETTTMKEVLEMSDGTSFGELGLNENRTRAASVLCKEDTHLIYLEKDYYLDIFVNYVRNKQNSVIETLKHNSMFTGFSNLFLIKLSYFFNEEKIYRYTQLFKEGQPAEYIYIVKDGEFGLSKKIDLTVKKKTDKRFCISKSIPKDAGIVIMSKGTFCNEEDILNEKYSFTCTCVSMTGSVLAIKKTDLIHKILGKDSQNTLNTLNLKQFLRSKQTANIFNVQRNFNLQVPSEPPKKTTQSYKKFKITKHEFFKTTKSRPLHIAPENFSPKYSPTITKSQKLLRFYRHTESSNVSMRKLIISPTALCKREGSAFQTEEQRGFKSTGSSVSWRFKFNKY